MSQITEARQQLRARMLEVQSRFESVRATSKKVAQGFVEQLKKGKPPSLADRWAFHVTASDAYNRIERALADIQRETDKLDAQELAIKTAVIKARVGLVADAIATASLAIGATRNDENFARALIRTLGPDQAKLIEAACAELSLRAETSSAQAKIAEHIVDVYRVIEEAPQ